jgi:hypothetical protein
MAVVISRKLLVEYSLVLTAISIVSFLVGLVVMRYVVIYVPADYFVREDRESQWWLDQHPAIRWTLFGLKNLLGAVLLVAGLILSLPAVPGPGVILIMVGLSLMNLPGKRRMELWLMRFPLVHRQIDRLRAKHGQPALELPEGVRGP